MHVTETDGGAMKRVPALLLCLAIPLTALSAVEIDGTIGPDEYPFSAEFADGAYTLSWVVENGTAFFALRARTTGWVAIGFDPVAIMDQADIVFGWVEQDGSVQVRDTFSTGMFGPHPVDTGLGGTFDILESAATESGGFTTFEFSRALETGDNADKPLPVGTELPIIWAYGSTDDFERIHDRAGSATIRLETGETAAAPVNIFIVLHATFLSIGFLLMAAGIGIARYLRDRKWWLKVHKPIGVTGAVSSVIGLVIGYFMVEMTTGIHFRVLHAAFGGTTVLLAILTPIMGQAFLKRKTNKQQLRLVHRYLGRITILMMAATIALGFAQAGLI
jgi:hypothetical protein